MGRRDAGYEVDGLGNAVASTTRTCGSRSVAGGSSRSLAMCVLFGSLGVAGAFVGVGLPGALRAASSAVGGRTAFPATGGRIPATGGCPFGLGAKPASNLCAAGTPSGSVYAPRTLRRSPSILGLQSVFVSGERRLTADDGDAKSRAQGMSSEEKSMIEGMRHRMRQRERSGHVSRAQGMSAQERSIIEGLRERMRQRERSGAVSPDTDQGAFMEKERVKEKRALRFSKRSSARKALQVPKTSCDVSEGKNATEHVASRSSSPHRSASPTRRSKVAVRETLTRGAAPAAGPTPFAPLKLDDPARDGKTTNQFKRSPSPTGAAAEACESGAVGRYTSWLPRKLSSYCKLSEVVDALELMKGSEVALPNAVGALNRLKKLQRQASGDRKLVARLNALLAFFGDIVLANAETLTGKLLSLTVNAVAESPSHRQLLRACAARVYTLHPIPYTLHPKPRTPHPAPYTPHHTPCTIHPTPYTLDPNPSSLIPNS